MAAQMHPAHAPGLVEARWAVPPVRRAAAAGVVHDYLESAAGWHTPLSWLPPCPSTCAGDQAPTHSSGRRDPQTQPSSRCCDTPPTTSATKRRPSDLIRRFDATCDHRRGVAGVGVLHGHPHDGARLQIHRVLGGVRQMRAAVLHLRDLRIGIVRMRPVLVRPLLLPFPIEPRQLDPRGRRDARRFESTRLVRLARVPTHDAPHCRVGSVVASVCPSTGARASRCNTHVNTAWCVSTSISRRVRDRVEWSGGASCSAKSRNCRMLSESAARHAMARSESKPSIAEQRNRKSPAVRAGDAVGSALQEVNQRAAWRSAPPGALSSRRIRLRGHWSMEVQAPQLATFHHLTARQLGTCETNPASGASGAQDASNAPDRTIKAPRRAAARPGGSAAYRRPSAAA